MLAGEGDTVAASVPGGGGCLFCSADEASEIAARGIPRRLLSRYLVFPPMPDGKKEPGAAEKN